MSYEYEEMMAEMNAREDYLHEAYGDEARMLADQENDMTAQELGFTSWAGSLAAGQEQREKLRGAQAIARAHAGVVEDDLPF